jgi:hypothetical protein
LGVGVNYLLAAPLLDVALGYLHDARDLLRRLPLLPQSDALKLDVLAAAVSEFNSYVVC